jgi:hypothetical protein
MKKLSATLKQMLDALAYAHAGEYLTPREKGRVLTQELVSDQQIEEIVPPEPVPADTHSKSKARRVALFLGSELPPEVMEYVIQTCMRLRHELTVLTFESESTGLALLQPHQEALDAAGVDMRLVTLSGKTIPGLARYLRSHPEVAFLACKDSGYLGRSYLHGSDQKNAIPVPVVVVATGEQTRKPLQPASNQDTRDTVAS